MAKAQAPSAKVAAKKRVVKVEPYGDAHVTASFNNIIISITNKQGQLISWKALLVKWVSKDQKRILHMPRRWLQLMPQKPHWMQV